VSLEFYIREQLGFVQIKLNYPLNVYICQKNLKGIILYTEQLDEIVAIIVISI